MKKRYIFTKIEKQLLIIILFLFIIISSTSLYTYIQAKNTYMFAQQNAEQKQQETSLYKDSYILPSQLTNAILPLYSQLLKQQDEHKDKSYAQLLLKNYDALSSSQIDAFNSYIKKIQVDFANQYSQISYYLKDNSTNTVYTNHESISSYLVNTDTIDTKTTWYMALRTDNDGTITKWISSSDIFPASEVTYRLQTSLSDYAIEESIQNDFILKDLQNIEVIYEVKKGSIYAPQDAYTSSYEMVDDTYYTVYTHISNMLLSFTCILFLLSIWQSKKTTQAYKLQTFTNILAIDLHIFIIFVLYYILCETNTSFISYLYHTVYVSRLIDFSYLFNTILYIILFFLYFILINALAWKIYTIYKSRNIRNFRKQLSIYYLYQYYLTYQDKFTSFFSYHKKLKLCIYVFIVFCISNIYTFVVALFFHEIFFLLCFIFPLYCLFLYVTFYIIDKKRTTNIAMIKQLTEHIVKEEFTSEIPQYCGKLEPIKQDLLKIHEQVETAIAEERRSQQMKTELITNVSHDLKTPLTSIISYIDLLKKEDISEDDKTKYLKILTTSSNRLKYLIEDLFDISKANSGNISLDLMELDVVALMKQVQLECDSMMKQRNLTIRNAFSDDKIIWTLDPQKTFRIFHNLLSNISKYALEDTRVFISIHDYHSVLEITLKNISKEEITYAPEELMERFVRADSSRTSEGSGLGLAIVKSFTELQKGHINISIDGDLFKISLRFQK